MAVTREELLQTAMELSDTDRLLLATDLIETVDEEIPGWSVDDPELHAELERRAADASPGIPWKTVESQLRADLNS